MRMRRGQLGSDVTPPSPVPWVPVAQGQSWSLSPQSEGERCGAFLQTDWAGGCEASGPSQGQGLAGSALPAENSQKTFISCFVQGCEGAKAGLGRAPQPRGGHPRPGLSLIHSGSQDMVPEQNRQAA